MCQDQSHGGFVVPGEEDEECQHRESVRAEREREKESRKQREKERLEENKAAEEEEKEKGRKGEEGESIKDKRCLSPGSSL